MFQRMDHGYRLLKAGVTSLQIGLYINIAPKDGSPCQAIYAGQAIWRSLGCGYSTAVQTSLCGGIFNTHTLLFEVTALMR